MSHNTHHPKLFIRRLKHSHGLDLPHYATAGSAGMDLRAAILENEDLIIVPGKRLLVPTGLIFILPNGFEAQIRPRSGLAFNNGVTCLNTPGTIDCDYRGEIKVLLINLGDEPFVIKRGQRIAQAIIAPAPQILIEETTRQDETDRGTSGFGSTGIH
ncbi:dUTP diphosphatase [Bartonella tamiae]|uniref:Deoxyuridine 5'-triphosphate nucleotidohydrolase n=1 Tax=Bartonella tamiae Th239 TaxID=1094558 RepID=J0QZV3_9HYPH|nr:dUTP diphosphatase [Bartonella tamiae Th239]EJF92622.1 dUTP diphosphatase [Bartonella tamiae Th307]